MSEGDRSGTSGAGRPFLTARWESLVLLNFECPAALLEPWVPRGTELDRWEDEGASEGEDGQPVLSLVGFRFVDTRVRGVSVPFHRTFEEVNLRFYVRRRGPDGEVRRGVVFLKEIVPRRGIALVARLAYNEPYVSLPTSHRVSLDLESGGSAEYTWWHRGTAHRLRGQVDGPARELTSGSEAEFITEHYWGYTRQRDGSTLEYRVEHRRWRVWETTAASYDPPPRSDLYGGGLGEVLSATPRSAFVAVGGPVAVYPGVRLGG